MRQLLTALAFIVLGTMTPAFAFPGCIHQGRTGPIAHYFCPSPSASIEGDRLSRMLPRARIGAQGRTTSEPVPRADSAILSREGTHQEFARATALRHGLDPLLVRAVITVESGWNPSVVSPKGARGLMQLMPATASRFGVWNSFDPRENIEGGVRYLAWLQGQFQDIRHVLAAYNAGENEVWRFGGIPPFPETQKYVRSVLALCITCSIARSP